MEYYVDRIVFDHKSGPGRTPHYRVDRYHVQKTIDARYIWVRTKTVFGPATMDEIHARGYGHLDRGSKHNQELDKWEVARMRYALRKQAHSNGTQ